MNKIIAIFALLTFSFTISAQTSIKVGLNRANLDVSAKDVYDVNAKSSYLVGLHYLFNLQEVIGLETGLMYQRFSTDFKSTENTVKFNREYIAVPILIKFNPGSVFSLGGGLQASYLIKDNFSENFINRSFDLSAQAQANINIFKKIGLEIGYNLGFLPSIEFVDKRIGNIDFERGDAKNKYFYGAVTYGF